MRMRLIIVCVFHVFAAGVTPLRNADGMSSVTKTAYESRSSNPDLHDGSEGNKHAIADVATYDTLKHNLHEARIHMNVIDTKLSEMIRLHPEVREWWSNS